MRSFPTAPLRNNGNSPVRPLIADQPARPGRPPPPLPPGPTSILHGVEQPQPQSANSRSSQVSCIPPPPAEVVASLEKAIGLNRDHNREEESFWADTLSWGGDPSSHSRQMTVGEKIFDHATTESGYSAPTVSSSSSNSASSSLLTVVIIALIITLIITIIISDDFQLLHLANSSAFVVKSNR